MSANCSTNYQYRVQDECYIIPYNIPIMVTLSEVIIPFAIILYLLNISISKNIDNPNLFCRNIFLKLGFIYNPKPLSEIYINLFIMWLLFGQGAAGLTSILFTKNDANFISRLLNKDIDELSAYMPRFIFDELIAVPIRYIFWPRIWDYIKFFVYSSAAERPYIMDIDTFSEDNCILLDYKYIILKSISWGLNVSFSIVCAAFVIADINYYALEDSPLIIATDWIQLNNSSCLNKTVITILVRLLWEIIQVFFANKVLDNKEYIKNLICCRRKNNQENIQML